MSNNVVKQSAKKNELSLKGYLEVQVKFLQSYEDKKYSSVSDKQITCKFKQIVEVAKKAFQKMIEENEAEWEEYEINKHKYKNLKMPKNFNHSATPLHFFGTPEILQTLLNGLIPEVMLSLKTPLDQVKNPLEIMKFCQLCCSLYMNVEQRMTEQTRQKVALQEIIDKSDPLDTNKKPKYTGNQVANYCWEEINKNHVGARGHYRMIPLNIGVFQKAIHEVMKVPVPEYFKDWKVSDCSMQTVEQFIILMVNAFRDQIQRCEEQVTQLSVTASKLMKGLWQFLPKHQQGDLPGFYKPKKHQ